jgi:hypothetical protein
MPPHRYASPRHDDAVHGHILRTVRDDGQGITDSGAIRVPVLQACCRQCRGAPQEERLEGTRLKEYERVLWILVVPELSDRRVRELTTEEVVVADLRGAFIA